jgi:Protein of unknown function (DUF1579)
MSKIHRFCLALTASLTMTPFAAAQEAPKPGPEHERLKQLEGTWDVVMKVGDAAETKGKVTYKMELGGLWLVSDFQGEFSPGQKFTGKGLDGYDALKKQYVSVWVDSMSNSPIISQGDYDKQGKVLTMIGEGPGPDGKPLKYKMTTEHRDKDHLLFTMFGAGADGKEGPLFTIAYKRQK